MQPLAARQAADPVVRHAVAAMLTRVADCGSPHALVAPDWQPFARALGSASWGSGDTSELLDGVAIAIGPIEHALDRLTGSTPSAVIGFVAPAAVRRRWWQRGTTCFLDPTRALWLAGWSPLAVTRVEVRVDRSLVEVVIGHARRTPEEVRGRAWQAQ